MKIIKIEIASIPMRVYIDKRFKNILEMLSKFKKYTGQTTFNMSISKGSIRSVKISKNSKHLYITGDDIDNLIDPFNTIGIMQAIFRFTGIHSIKKNIFLLHGSSSIMNDKAFCFGDDGDNIGKTISSFECALKSKSYIGDEFCFLDINTKKIFSYNFIPIHLREKVKKHFTNNHKLLLPNTTYIENNSGYFIQPKKIFKVIKSKKLCAFIFPHFTKKKSGIIKLSNKQAETAIRSCITAHISKLFYPFLDRMQFAKQTDIIKTGTNNNKILKSLVKKFSLQTSSINISMIFPCYNIYIKKPCDIVNIISSIK